MTTIQIIQFILEILLLGLAFYIAFFKSYFQEKGKNLATKEDIGEITQTVEKIKNQISFSTQSKLSLKTEERNSVVACYEKYNYWLNSVLDVYFSDIADENQIRLKDVEDKLNDAKFQFELAEARMQLFIHNKDISAKILEIKLKTLELQHNCERYMDKLRAWLIEMQKAKVFAGALDKYKEIEETLKKKSEILKEYNNSKTEIFRVIAPLNGDFQLLAYRHIQSLIEE